MKKVVSLILALLMVTFIFTSCEKKIEDIEGVTITDTETDYVVIDVTDFGKIVIRLCPDVAPETVANFKKLVSEGFYDGLIFHRVVEDFVIQGGDPLGNGKGGSDTTIKGEFSANGFDNTLKHERGVISMARSEAFDSASSQFFICHKTTKIVKGLDGNYAAFGYVIYGMDVVDEIASVKVNFNDKPLTNVVIKSIKFAEVSEPLEDTTDEADS